MKFEVDKELGLLKIDNEPKVRMTKLEAKLVAFLIKYPNQFFAPKEIAKRIGSTEGSVTNQVPSIRKKYPVIAGYLRTEGKQGYYWWEPEE